MTLPTYPSQVSDLDLSTRRIAYFSMEIALAKDVPTDSGGLGGAPLHPDAMAMIMGAMLKAGFSQADVDMMSRTNPARALGLQ